MAHAWKACWVQALGGSNPPFSAAEQSDRELFETVTSPRAIGGFVVSDYSVKSNQEMEKQMRVGYVVLYVTDPDACLRFWTEQVGMVEKGRKMAGELAIVKIGFADQEFSFELVPLALMKENPEGLDLATPSIAFNVDDLAATRDRLVANGVMATEPGVHSGVNAFAFQDNEGRWFAVTN